MNCIPVTGSVAPGSSGASVAPVLGGVLDGSGNVQADVGNQVLPPLLASAARTASATTATQTNPAARGIVMFLSITAASGTGGLQFQLQTQDPVSGNWVNYAGSSSAITTTGEFFYPVYPAPLTGFSGSEKAICTAPLPPVWRVVIIANDSSSYTYSLGAVLLI